MISWQFHGQCNIEVLHCFRNFIFEPVEVLDHLVERGVAPTRPRSEGKDILSPTILSSYIKGACDIMKELDAPFGIKRVLAEGIHAVIHDPEQWKLIVEEIELREELRQKIREARKKKQWDVTHRLEEELRSRKD